MLYGGILLVSVFCTFALSYGLECYSCQNLNHSLCNVSTTCGQNQFCYMDIHDNLYSMGCLDSQNCKWQPGSLIGRDVDETLASLDYRKDDIKKRQMTNCHECCSSDGCNRDLCHHLKPTQCIDDESLDCAKLATLFNICDDIHKAKLSCPKFCNLCQLVDGQWSAWAPWSACSVTCNVGNEIRTRMCTNPAPSNGGLDCIGDSTDTQVCQRQTCPVHGGWSNWSPWGSCSATCDIGIQRRDRTCSNPWPGLGGNHCFGDFQENRMCISPPCADGGWSDWGNWSTCSETCGTGTLTRTRTCTNPRPSLTGRNCDGNSNEVGICKTQTCSRDKIAFTAVAASYSALPVFSKVLTNIGGAYSNANGKFTCPIAGLYHFATTITKSWLTYTDVIECHIYVNSADMMGTWEAPYDSDDDKGGYSLTLAGTFHLNVNDTVFVKCPRGSEVFRSEWCTFTGFLISTD